MLELRILALLLDWNRCSQTCPRGNLSLSFSCVMMFLNVEHFACESFLVSIFALFVPLTTLCFTLLLVLPVNFGLRTNLDVRFDSLEFFFSAWARVLILVTSVALDTSFISAHIPPRLFGFNVVSV